MSRKYLYEFTLEEHHGETHYYYDAVLYAKSQEDAERLADNYASTFYGEPTHVDHEDGGHPAYHFNYGAIIVHIDGPVRRTTKKAYQERVFAKDLLVARTE
jgi:hypothetical protein